MDFIDRSLEEAPFSSKHILNFLDNGPAEDRPPGMPDFDWRDVFNLTDRVIRMLNQYGEVSVTFSVFSFLPLCRSNASGSTSNGVHDCGIKLATERSVHLSTLKLGVRTAFTNVSYLWSTWRRNVVFGIYFTSKVRFWDGSIQPIIQLHSFTALAASEPCLLNATLDLILHNLSLGNFNPQAKDAAPYPGG